MRWIGERKTKESKEEIEEAQARGSGKRLLECQVERREGAEGREKRNDGREQSEGEERERREGEGTVEVR